MQTGGQAGLETNRGSGQTGGYKDRRPAAAVAGQWGSCPTQALSAEAVLATRLNFQFSAPVLGPGRRPGSRAFMGSFPSREEQATAVNSLIPIACPCKPGRTDIPPAQDYPNPCAGGLGTSCPRGSQGQAAQSPHGSSPVPSKARTAGSSLPGPLPWIRLRGTRGLQWHLDSRFLGVVPPSNSSPRHPQSQRTLRMCGAQRWS